MRRTVNTADRNKMKQKVLSGRWATAVPNIIRLRGVARVGPPLQVWPVSQREEMMMVVLYHSPVLSDSDTAEETATRRGPRASQSHSCYMESLCKFPDPCSDAFQNFEMLTM